MPVVPDNRDRLLDQKRREYLALVRQAQGRVEQEAMRRAKNRRLPLNKPIPGAYKPPHMKRTYI